MSAAAKYWALSLDVILPSALPYHTGGRRGNVNEPKPVDELASQALQRLAHLCAPCLESYFHLLWLAIVLCLFSLLLCSLFFFVCSVFVVIPSVACALIGQTFCPALGRAVMRAGARAHARSRSFATTTSNDTEIMHIECSNVQRHIFKRKTVRQAEIISYVDMETEHKHPFKHVRHTSPRAFMPSLQTADHAAGRDQ